MNESPLTAAAASSAAVAPDLESDRFLPVAALGVSSYCSTSEGLEYLR
jgi:hypothetical protein